MKPSYAMKAILFIAGASAGVVLGACLAGRIPGLATFDETPGSPPAAETERGATLAGLIRDAAAAEERSGPAASIKLYARLLAELPDDAVGLRLIEERSARASIAAGKPGAAVNFVEVALATDSRRHRRRHLPVFERGDWPGSTHGLLVALADAYADRGDWAAAASVYELVSLHPGREVYDRSPWWAGAQVKLVRAHALEGKVESARAVLAGLSSEMPDSAMVRLAEAVLLGSKKDGAR